MPPPNCEAEEAARDLALEELYDAAAARTAAEDLYQAKLAAANQATAALAACQEGPPGDGERGTRKGRRTRK